jgi:hypothetical protein
VEIHQQPRFLGRVGQRETQRLRPKPGLHCRSNPAYQKTFVTYNNRWSEAFPLFRPEHRSFWLNRPDRGAAGGRSFSQGQGWPFENPRQKREAQETGGIRVAFLLGTFLWPNKEKYLGCRAETRHKKQPVAVATQQKQKPPNNSKADVLGYC